MSPSPNPSSSPRWNSRRRSRFATKRRVSTLRLIALLALVVVSTVGAASGAASANQQGLTLGARFTDASPLVPGSTVKIDGVQVGQVVSINVVDGNQAMVVMHLDNAALPVHRDGSATIRAVSLLGERYVDLNRGSPSAPVVTEGDALSASQNSQAPALDQVLNVVNQPTGDALAQLITALGQGLSGNGGNANAIVTALAPAMTNTDSLMKVLDQQNGVLNDLVDKLQPVAQALANDNGQTLNGLLNSTLTLANATASVQQQLQSTLAGLPDTLAQARSTLAQLTGTADQTTPTLAAVRPTTDNLNAISQELLAFSQVANPALASAEPVLDRAKQLLDQARPVADQLSAAGPNLRTAITSANPIVTDLTHNIDNVLGFLRYWALTTNGYDGVSHYFRGHVVVSTQVLNALFPQLTGPAPVAPAGPTAPAPSAPAGGPQPPPATGQNLIGGLLNGLLTPSPSPGGSATGLNQQQEGGLLQYLLGGGH